MGRLMTCLGAIFLLAGCGSGHSAPSGPPRPIDAAIVPPTVVGMNLASSTGGTAPSVANLIQAHSSLAFRTERGYLPTAGNVKLDATGHPLDVAAGDEVGFNTILDEHTDIRSLKCTGSPGWDVDVQHGPFMPGARSFRLPIAPNGPGDNSLGGVFWFKAQHAGASLPVAECRDARLPADALFDPQLLAGIKPFRVIRFMDWMNTNGAPHREWSDRPTPKDLTFERGVSVETMVALANESGADPWFTLPWDASPDYYRAFATYVRDHLAPGRVAYVELSNEVWNPGFTQSQDAQAKGKLAYPGEQDGRAKSFYYGDRVRAMMAIWSDVFQGQEKRIVRVAAWIAAWPPAAEEVLGHKDTWRSVDMFATAPYFGMNGFEVKADSPKALIDALFAQSPKIVDASIDQAKAAKAIASKYGLRYGTYEGGPSYINGMPEMQKQLSQLTHDPRMYALYMRFLTRWRKEVGGLYMAYNSVGDAGQYGSWGHLDYPSQPLSEAPRMRALVDFIQQSPPSH